MSNDRASIDAHLWLEEVEGDDALDWVRARNADAEAAWFATPTFDAIKVSTLEVLDADDRIDMATRHGDRVHNFWTDAEHRRGLLRRATWRDYVDGEPQWETILDLDALCDEEGESWVFHGSATRRPDRRRALIDLSPGGSDASVTREFDLVEKRFIPADEGGFVRPLAKGGLTWIDDDTVYVTSDFGPGTLTRSGYPRTVRRWRRGTPIESAEVVFEGPESDVAVSASVSTVAGFEHHVFQRAPDFFTEKSFVLPAGAAPDAAPVELPLPDDAQVGVFERWVFVHPRSPFTWGADAFPAGSLLAAPLASLVGDAPELAVFRPLFTPTTTAALSDFACTRNRVVLDVLDDVRSSLLVATPPALGEESTDSWSIEPLAGAPDVWTANCWAVDAAERDDVWVSGSDFITPERLDIVSLDGSATRAPSPIRQAPARFDADGIEIEQRFVASADGTRVPYFVVGHTDALATTDGSRPTLLNAYGGFEVPRVAAYSSVIGRSWLADGGVHVLANIRGGGEYGPDWHRAGLREKRLRVYEDLEAVAGALHESGITSPAHLGVSGGSNGGLLVGNMYVRSPELFGAVVCQVPLLDMRRYHLLLAGASWMAEYGDPDDPADWAYLQGFSPYQMFDGIPADRELPPILITTSTRDDRVHPGHARKMAAKLVEAGRDVTYWENIEGGHGGAADADQQATMQALIFSFLRDRLSLGPVSSAAG